MDFWTPRKVFWLRWLLLLPALIVVWYAWLAGGLLGYFWLERGLCPPGQMISGVCENTWVVRCLQLWINAMAAGVAASLVATAYGLAPRWRWQVALIVYLLGAVAAWSVTLGGRDGWFAIASGAGMWGWLLWRARRANRVNHGE